ncbi:DUF2325 domain-containing protein [Arcobacter roscoffensis]|uniref:DUF2325 domain-containing protein n=1 Tax=Arcobacter roscoffensis TaxID=2961520 RepID=A0ABY5E2V6_9BACT|nr:DUF2325 domain-containing protein [Arcobacter roscoffensis]UTJ05904.1 DUF2325 domain-containing protein [Arcobacter roscoffensis]|tara:strand:- start:123 stop:455 length:333 start_codon:yes stop_codon:yes gene_type:complete
MSILVIGGDKISPIVNMLENLGAKTINHWDARKKSSAPKKKVPMDTDCIVMLTSFLNHNTMLKYKNEAKRKNIPFICAKRSLSCVYDEYVKIMGITDCSQCYANCTKKKD